MRTRSKLATLVALVSLLGLVLVNVGGASGLHDEATAEDTVLRLHLDTDADPDTDGYFRHGTTQQDLTASQCLVNDPASTETPLVTLSGSDKGSGLSFDSLGTRSKGPGRSCGRVDATESFTISIKNSSGDPEADPPVPADALAGLNFDSMELDIEAKKDAIVVATTFLGGPGGVGVGSFILQTGGSATNLPEDGETTHLAISDSDDMVDSCLQGVSDSGSDNGANDNCRWVIDPDSPFDTVVFTADNGEFGLEGGKDGTLPYTGTDSDSLFHLTDVGVLNCGDTVSTGDGLGDPLVSVTRQAQTGCQLKEFTLGSAHAPPLPMTGLIQAFSFAPSGGGAGQLGATFEMTVTWVKEPALPQLHVTQMDFNGDGDTTDPNEGNLLWCEGTAANPTLPSGVPWCRVEQHVLLAGTVSGVTYVQMVEKLYGTEDPNGWR